MVFFVYFIEMSHLAEGLVIAMTKFTVTTTHFVLSMKRKTEKNDDIEVVTSRE